jgi:hypothetical protein
MKSLKIFNIIDPGMADQFGHHRDINISLGQVMLSRGYQVNLFTHKSYTPSPWDPVDANFKIVPHFNISAYSVYRNELSIADIVIKHNIAEQKFHEDLSKLNLQGQIHLSNLFSYQLKAICKIKAQHKITACIHVHPNRFTPHGEFLWAKTSIEINHQLENIEIFAIEEPLLHEMDRITTYGNGIRKIAFPLNLSELPTKVIKTNRIGILGSLRIGQGFGKIVPTIDLIRSLGFGVLIQDSRNMIKIPESPSIKKIGYIEKLSDAFKDCDAVLLDYEPDTYQFMGSGVLWEALAGGMPFLYTRGTALASLASKWNVGIQFSFFDNMSLKNALIDYKDNQDFHKSKSLNIMPQVRSQHNLNNYLNSITA